MTSQQTEPTQQEPQEPQGQPSPQGDDPEKGFWERLEKTVEAVTDRVVDKKVKAIRDNATGTQRGNGRNTLPKFMADIIFGPEK